MSLLPAALVLALALVVGAALRPVRTSGPATPSEAFHGAVRHARRVALVAWAVLVPVPALLAQGVTASLPGTAKGALVGAAPALAGTAFLVVHVVGELTWPRPVGLVRRAPLVRRRVRDVVPRPIAVLTVTWTVLLSALLALSAAVAGTGGRSLSAQHADGHITTISPFPGSYYGRVIGPATLVLLALCAAVLVLVARRPAVADTAPADDLTLRRTSVRRVLAGVQLVVAWTLAGCLFFAANGVRGVEPRWMDVFGPGSSGTVAGVGLGVALAVATAAVVVAVRALRTTSTVRAGAEHRVAFVTTGPDAS